MALRRWRAIAMIAVACAFALLLGCGAPRPPAAPLRSQLDLRPPALGLANAGPPAVVFAAPSGEAPAGAEIAVVFNQPLRALELAPDQPAISAQLDPVLPGRWEWVGTAAWRFVPAQPLPAATHVTVTVPAGEIAPGKVLASPYSWSFESERPRLLASSPTGEEWELVPVKAPIRLTFNLPVDPADVLRRVSLKRAGSDTSVVLEVDPEATRAPEEAVFRPVAALEESQPYRLDLGASLVSKAGPLPLGKLQQIRFKTAGPLRVLDARCAPAHDDPSRCDPDQPVTLKLSQEGYSGLDVVAGASTKPSIPLTGNYYGEDGDDEAVRYRIAGAFKPGGTYALKLESAPATADREAVRLAAPFERTFVFGDRTPSMQLGAQGTFLPASKPLLLQLATTNVAEAGLSVARISPEQVMARLAGAEPALVFGATLELQPGKRNERTRASVPFDDLVSRDARGPLLVRASWRPQPGSSGAAQTIEHELQRTDLGLISTITARHVHVWVTRMSDGKPVSGAEVELRRVLPGQAGNEVLARGRSDAQGIARVEIPASVPRPADRRGQVDESARLVAFVRLGADWAYQQLDTQAEARGVGIAYTERGLYRPGEWVHLAGIARERLDGELVVPARRIITVIVTDPAGRETRRFQVPLSDFGSWHQRLRLPDTAPLGLYWVNASLGNIESRTRFSVAEYHPTDFTVAAAIDARTFLRGDDLDCVASGSYLHGGPMAGARVRVELTRSRGSAPPLRELDGFSLQDSFAPEPRSDLVRKTAALDRTGEYHQRARLDLPGMNGPERVSCVIYASDLDERELYESDSSLVHPAEAYLGVALPPRVEPGERFEAKVHAASLVDRPYPMAATVELSRRITDPASGEATEEVLDRCEVQTGDQPVTCSFLAPDDTYRWGERVLVVRARGNDRQGRAIQAADGVVPEKMPVPTEPQVDQPPVHQPSLTASVPERTLQPGEVVDVALSSPWTTSSTALVRVRNDDIHWHRVVDLPAAGAVVSVPIEDRMIPESVVEVFAVRDSDSDQDHHFITVSHAKKVLAVKVEPSTATAAPGDELDLQVEVLDAQGRPVQAEVTLYGADVATLWLSHYTTPKPEAMWQWGFGGGYEDHDARRDLFVSELWTHRARPPRVRMGATSISGPDIRTDFRQTVFFATGLVTDDRGRVKRRVRLPDGLTTYRFMAVVTTADDRFGSGDAEVVSKKPLLVRPKLPAVVRSGDRFEVTALVTSSDGSQTDVSVALSARGLTIEGPASALVDLQADVARRVAFWVRADEAGAFELTMRASTKDGKARDAVSSRGEVVAPAFVETVALYGDSRTPVAEALGDLSDIRQDVGELTLTLARTRLAGLDHDIGGLLEYPYGCTEQTASRLLPLASLRGLSAEVGVVMPADATQQVADAIERLSGHQRDDGGFGYWAGSRQSDPWLSAYATWVLLEARRSGTQVPAALVSRASQYLRTFLTTALPAEDPSLGPVADQRLATAAFIVDVLAATPTPSEDAMGRLFAVRDRLPAFARALLLHAMATASYPKQDQRRTLLTELEGSLLLDGDAAHVAMPRADARLWLPAVLASETRAAALVLRAMMAQAPAHPMAPKLVTGLLADLRARTATTHERAWALVALDAYRRAHPTSTEALEARVFIGQRLIGEVELEPGAPAQETLAISNSQVAAAGKGARLTFDVEGGELHYQARLRYARHTLPDKPVAAGMQLSKRVSRMDPFTHEVIEGGDGSMQLHTGDFVRVDLQVVTTAPRRVVAIDDPLAGGLVPIDANMRTGLREDVARTWDHRELRDDRVVFFVDALPAGIHTFSYWARAQNQGRFVVPPAQAFEMYAPEVRGATVATKITVRKRGSSSPSP